MKNDALKYLGIGVVIVALGCISFSTSFALSLYKSQLPTTPSRLKNNVIHNKPATKKVEVNNNVSKTNTDKKKEDAQKKNNTDTQSDKNIHQEDTVKKKIILSNKDTKDIEERHQIKHNNVLVNENPVVTTSITYSNQNNGQTTGVTKEVIIP